MNGESHRLIANLSLACLDTKERYILYPRWGGIESGATLSDEFRIMWEYIDIESKDKQLVHRCYIDSENTKDHGCVTRALNHAEGSIAFINDYLGGKLDDSYTEDEFLENLGMFLGIACHHICDLCTPAHVGHKIDYKKAGYKSWSRFHNQIERDIGRFSRRIWLKMTRPKIVEISSEYFWNIAQETYDNTFVRLESLYPVKDQQQLIDMASVVISAGVKHTCDVWHTILHKTKMTTRKWSFQPLL